MTTAAPRKIVRSRILSSTLVLAAWVSSHACMKSDCADTESCGSFTPASGCGWRLDDDTVVYSTDDLEARDATWSEADGWTLPNGSHPVFSCDLPANPNDDAGMNGNGGSSGEGSGNSGASNAGETGNSGTSNAGNGGSNGGNTGNGGNGGATDTDGGNTTMLCGDTLVTGCTPAEQNAVFVDAAAPEGGDGSLASPLNSIVDAFGVATTNAATDIYVCAGNYDERVVITDSEAGIDLHGGFNCNGFTYDGSVPVVSRSAGGYALYIDALNSPILIEDLAFTAVDANNPGESSIAAFVSAADSVTFDRCQFTAGAGMDGDDGVTEDFVEGTEEGVNWPVLSTLEGHDGTNSSGGATLESPIMCPAGDESFGGQGGDTNPTDGVAGGPAGRGGDAGQAGDSCGFGGSGEGGTEGPSGDDGNGGSTAGTLDAAGFSPNAGQDGLVGEVGGGGGGGAGAGNGGGGSGGVGGCGGNFGPGGQGGGASIALLVYNSIVIIQASSLTSVDAGDGGNGDQGQDGQSGSTFGAGNPSGCPGGMGARGGNGGGGGGGAGGVSVGVLWSGTTAPVLDQATTDAITVGALGAAGTGGGVDNDGTDGFAEATYEL